MTRETNADVSCTKTGYNHFQLHKHPNKRKQQPTLRSSFFPLLNGTQNQLCSIRRHNNSSATSRWRPSPPPEAPPPYPPRSGGLRPRGGAIAEVRPAPPLSPPPGVRPRQRQGVSSRGGGGERGECARVVWRPLVASANGRSPL